MRARHEPWPVTVAREATHSDRYRRGAMCTAGAKSPDRCTCTPDPEVERQTWWHLARMAAARRASGRSLSADDRRALDRYPQPGGYVRLNPDMEVTP